MSSNDEKVANIDSTEAFQSQLTKANLQEFIDRLGDEASSADPNSANQYKFSANAHTVGFIAHEIRAYVTDPAHRASFHGVGGNWGGGVGKWWGELYTDDIERLYSDTLSFEVTIVMGAYLKITFFDGHSVLLGHFHGGGPGFGLMEGGGKGRWTKG